MKIIFKKRGYEDLKQKSYGKNYEEKFLILR